MAAEEPKRSALKRGKRPVRLGAGLEKSLSAYASAAAAAGVSLLTLASSASAKIVYTPTDTPIPEKGYVSLDLNHDGVADFIIVNSYNISCCGAGALWVSVGCALRTTGPVSPPKGETCNYLTNQIWGRGMASGRFASALPAGFKVRANKWYFQAAKYPFFAVMGAIGAGAYGQSSNSEGQWLYAKDRYLGLQFVIKGQVHYGWARFTVTFPPQPSFGILAILTGYAYETEANTPIITGKIKGPDVITLDPATLGHLAAGASQIPAWRGARNSAGALDDSRQKAGQGSPVVP
jgi:hypothetical protein